MSSLDAFTNPHQEGAHLPLRTEISRIDEIFAKENFYKNDIYKHKKWREHKN